MQTYLNIIVNGHVLSRLDVDAGHRAAAVQDGVSPALGARIGAFHRLVFFYVFLEYK